MTEESPKLCENTIQLYREYSGINDPNELLLHLTAIQSRLAHEGKINYRCIQTFKFAFSRIYHRFFYKRIIELAQEMLANNLEPYFLDVGCCTGTDLRKLLIDGYPKDYLIGLDIEQFYIECGYALFKDNQDTCPIKFIVDDMFNSKCQLPYKMAIIHAGSVFHLFDGPEMMRDFLKKLIVLLKPGGLLVGGHACSETSTTFYRQSTQSMKYYMGLEEFKQLLESEGFVSVELEAKSKTNDLPNENEIPADFTAYWISFCAVYAPK